jgi:uncharacterized membrane-anchored protein
MVSFSMLDNSRVQTCKVPQITWMFWIVKCCATTVGETLSDFFNVNLGLGLGGAAALFFPLLLLCLCAQFYFPYYVPSIYWLAVILMSICGTICTDGFHDNLGVELWIENIVYLFFTVLTFTCWYRSEGTLDIHSIYTVRRESFYWLAIIFTFALGTAIGDGIAEGSGIGYGPTLALFVGAMIVVMGLWYFKVLDEITSFWVAYVLTRPLGASTGDLLAQPKSAQAAGLGTGTVSIIFTAIIIVIVGILTITKYDQLPIKDEKEKPEDAIHMQQGL